MTAKAALCKALLDGRVLNIKNCFELIGLTNCPREISRMVEQPFGVIVSRTQMEGHSRYGQAVTWYNYRLNNTDHNKEGIEKMRAYINEQSGITATAENHQKEKNKRIEQRLTQPSLFDAGTL